jgi:hypothetical protein
MPICGDIRAHQLCETTLGVLSCLLAEESTGRTSVGPEKKKSRTLNRCGVPVRVSGQPIHDDGRLLRIVETATNAIVIAPVILSVV